MMMIVVMAILYCYYTTLLLEETQVLTLSTELKMTIATMTSIERNEFEILPCGVTLQYSFVPYPGNCHARYVFKSCLLSTLKCPPCRGFTPQLVKTYNKLKEQGKDFEIIFASSDRDEASFSDYFGEMPWLALPFGDNRKAELSELCEVEGKRNISAPSVCPPVRPPAGLRGRRSVRPSVCHSTWAVCGRYTDSRYIRSR